MGLQAHRGPLVTARRSGGRGQPKGVQFPGCQGAQEALKTGRWHHEQMGEACVPPLHSPPGQPYAALTLPPKIKCQHEERRPSPGGRTPATLTLHPGAASAEDLAATSWQVASPRQPVPPGTQWDPGHLPGSVGVWESVALGRQQGDPDDCVTRKAVTAAPRPLQAS